MKLLSIKSFIAIAFVHLGHAFLVSHEAGSRVPWSLTPILSRHQQYPLHESKTELEPSSDLTVVENVISDMHESSYPFRIVVVGNGAILETTSTLGPTMKSTISPKTGGKLVTLASEDQSFEFHVKVDQVDKVVFVQSARPAEGGEEKILRICRLMDKEGGSICSLILNEYGQAAIDWFSEMEARYSN